MVMMWGVWGVGETAAALRTSAAEEANAALMELVDAAASRNKPLLWDDDFVSIGLGRTSRTWGVRELPESICLVRRKTKRTLKRWLGAYPKKYSR